MVELFCCYESRECIIASRGPLLRYGTVCEVAAPMGADDPLVLSDGLW